MTPLNIVRQYQGICMILRNYLYYIVKLLKPQALHHELWAKLVLLRAIPINWQNLIHIVKYTAPSTISNIFAKARN